MDFRQTRHQVARATRPDAEIHDKIFLIKRAMELRATYQIRLLAYRASQEGKKFIIEIPAGCKVHDGLRALVKKYPKMITIARA